MCCFVVKHKRGISLVEGQAICRFSNTLSPTTAAAAHVLQLPMETYTFPFD